MSARVGEERGKEEPLSEEERRERHEEVSPETPFPEERGYGRNSPYPEAEAEEIITELRKLSNRIDAALSEGDNPVSAKCATVLGEIPKCYDFSGTRRFAACRAWDLMESEKISWREAISRAWEEVKSKCVWD